MNVNPKSIAFFLGDITRSGGTERSCISVANGISSKSDCKVFIISNNEKGTKPFFELNENVEIIYFNLPTSKRNLFKIQNKIKGIVKEKKFDYLVAVEVMSILFLIPIFFSKKIRKTTKLIVWEHFNYSVSVKRKLRVYLRLFAAKFADYIVVLTKKDVDLWKAGSNVKGNIVSINNPSPFDISKIDYNTKTKTVVAIGRLTYQKGFDRLIEIWNKLLEIYPDRKEWILEIIGSGPDKVLLKDRIDKYNLNNNIILIPNTNNIRSHYEKASFLVMTSRFEGLPMTLIEAQSFKLPIIAYDCLTGPSEVITKDSGFLIEDGDQFDFIEKTNYLMNNEELRLTMSKSASNEVGRFSIEKVINNWLKIIKF